MYLSINIKIFIIFLLSISLPIYISSFNNDDQCIIILGSQNKTELNQRLYKSIELYHSLLNNEFPVHFIVSGKGKELDNSSEALHMKNILLNNSIIEDAITIENESTNTAENIYFIYKILKNKIKYNTIYLISHDFHIDGGRLPFIINTMNDLFNVKYLIKYIKVFTPNRSHYSHHVFLEKYTLLNSSKQDIKNIKLKYNI